MTDIGEIKKILDIHEKRIYELEKSLKIQQQTTTSLKSTSLENYVGLTKSIFDLIEVSFFDSPKGIKEIMEKLKVNAIFHPITNFPRPLLKLIKDKKLRRLKENNKWKYVKY